MVDIIVIGGGPAGLTAAVYARRAGKSVLVLEKDALGVQITWSPKVENYPAVPAVSGMELGNLMAEQARNMGFRICTLGKRILRCETAPLCALSAVMYDAGEF